MKQLEKEIFGIPVIKSEFDQKKGIPLFIKDLYYISEYRLLERYFMLVEPKENAIDFSVYQKHIKIISESYRLPCVIYLEHITPYQRKKLINSGTPFIYQEKQVYMPFIGMMLEEHFKKKSKQKDYLSYISQFIFLFLYYRPKNTPIRFIDIAKYTKSSKANCTRAISELIHFNLVNVDSKGREKYVQLKETRKQTLNEAFKLMRSPVQKQVFVDDVDYSFIKSNLLALSKKTNLAQHSNDYYYAIDRMEYLSNNKKFKVIDSIMQESTKRLEIWMYDPSILSDKGIVDDISLLLLFKDNKDYRIDNALEEIRERHGLNYNA